jgi:predicted methyltransferase
MNTPIPRRTALAALAALAAATTVTTTACSGLPAQTSAPAPTSPPEDALLKAVLDMPHRSAANRARDGARHPYETLRFFGLQPQLTVVELTPGAAWYSEILAPYLRERGRFYMAQFAKDAASEGQRRARANFEARMAKDPALYDRATLGELPGAAGFGSDIAPSGGADLILTFRNVHNWLEDTTLDAKLDACCKLLKPGGTLGVVDHRAASGTPIETMMKSGYVTEALMEERARAAGFRLAARSEINANPRDTKDHAGGVWSLPPTLSGKDVGREGFVAIGESDRFTHRYVKAQG